jgi:hypothetical protein
VVDEVRLREVEAWPFQTKDSKSAMVRLMGALSTYWHFFGRPVWQDGDQLGRRSESRRRNGQRTDDILCAAINSMSSCRCLAAFSTRVAAPF